MDHRRPALPSLVESGLCLWGTVLATPSDPIRTKCLCRTPRILNPNQGAKKRPLSPGRWVPPHPPQSLSALSSPGGPRVPAARASYSLGPRLLLCSPGRQAAWGEGGRRDHVTGEPTPAQHPGDPPRAALAGLRRIGLPVRPLSPPGSEGPVPTPGPLKSLWGSRRAWGRGPGHGKG